jgi:hypothetical protein
MDTRFRDGKRGVAWSLVSAELPSLHWYPRSSRANPFKKQKNGLFWFWAEDEHDKPEDGASIKN